MSEIQRSFGRRGSAFPIKDLNQKNIAAGLVSGIFIITGPVALILEAATNGQFTMTQTIQWVFSVYVFGGLFGIILPLYYRIPIVGGHSISAVAFLATVTTQFTFHELVGAYIVSGLLMLLIGYLGFFSKLMKMVPKEIIAAMLAGMITKYMVNYVVSTTQLLVVGGASLVAFFIFSRWRTRIPPIIAAILAAFILLLLTVPLESNGWSEGLLVPQIQIPEFNLLSFISVSFPLALLVLSNDAAVGLGALEQSKYSPPVNRIISLSGIFSIIASFFGGQSSNIAGMASAICSDDEAGPKEKRYMGAVVSGVLLFLFGLFAWKLVPLIQVLPKEFISIIVGFSLIGVFSNSLTTGFSRPTMRVSTAFAFMIALSNITIWNISAPVWSLLIGSLIAKYIEKDTMAPIEKKKTA